MNSPLPPTKKLSRILSHEEQLEVVRRIARFERPSEIEEYLTSRGKKLASVQRTIAQYKTTDKWKPFIEKFRAEYNAEISDVPIANKIRRLTELNETYERLRIYEAIADKPSSKIRAITEQLRTLDQAQQEVEGKVSIEQNNLYFTQFNNMTKIQFDEYRLKLAEKISRYKQLETPEAS